jgi:N-acyl-D-amino-acid deacylase
MLCPGFVDLHAHSALEPFRDPLLAPKILQGFTTEVICPDGLAPTPVRDHEARRAWE